MRFAGELQGADCGNVKLAPGSLDVRTFDVKRSLTTHVPLFLFTDAAMEGVQSPEERRLRLETIAAFSANLSLGGVSKPSRNEESPAFTALAGSGCRECEPKHTHTPPPVMKIAPADTAVFFHRSNLAVGPTRRQLWLAAVNSCAMSLFHCGHG